MNKEKLLAKHNQVSPFMPVAGFISFFKRKRQHLNRVFEKSSATSFFFIVVVEGEENAGSSRRVAYDIKLMEIKRTRSGWYTK